MKNEEIIRKAAVDSGLFSEDELGKFDDKGKELPLHTMTGWKLRDKSIKCGEQGIEVKLWRKKDNGFYKTKAILYGESQVEEEIPEYDCSCI